MFLGTESVCVWKRVSVCWCVPVCVSVCAHSGVSVRDIPAHTNWHTLTHSAWTHTLATFSRFGGETKCVWRRVRDRVCACVEQGS